MQEIHNDGTESGVQPLTPGREVEEIRAALEKQATRLVRVFAGQRPVFEASRITQRSPQAVRARKAKRKMVKRSRKRNRGIR